MKKGIIYSAILCAAISLVARMAIAWAQWEGAVDELGWVVPGAEAISVVSIPLALVTALISIASILAKTESAWTKLWLWSLWLLMIATVIGIVAPSLLLTLFHGEMIDGRSLEFRDVISATWITERLDWLGMTIVILFSIAGEVAACALMVVAIEMEKNVLNSQLAEKDKELESLSTRVNEQVASMKLAHQKEIEAKQRELEELSKSHNEELQKAIGEDSVLLMAARILVSGRHSSSWIQVLECIISCSIKNGGKDKGCTFNELFAEMLVKYNISSSKADAVKQSIDSLVNHGRIRVDQATKRIYLV